MEGTVVTAPSAPDPKDSLALVQQLQKELVQFAKSARLETLQNLPSSTQALQQARRGARSGSRPGSAQTWRSNSPAQYDSMLVEHSAQQADTGPDEFQQAHERKLFASYNWKEKMYTADGISLGSIKSDNQGTPQRMPRIHEEEGWGEASGHTRPSSAGGMQSDKPMERTWQLKQPPKSKLRGLHLREQAAQPSRAAQLIAVEARRLVRHASEDGTALNLRSRLHSREQLLAVLEGCKALPRLQRLDLAGNMLTDDLAGFQELFKQPLFCDLDISDNRARELAAGLRANRSLQALDLAQNGLTDLGGSYIALSLLHNRSLTDLDLGSNQLGTETCSVLAHALSWNPVLKRLQLQHNPLGQEGAAKLLEAVAPGGSALTDLQLQHCSLVDVQPLAPSQQPNLLAGKTKAAKAKGMGKKKGASKQKEVQAPAKAAKAVPARPASAAGKAAPSAMSNTRQVFTLSRPAHRVRVLQLLAEVRQPGAPAWRNVLLNGKRIKGAVPPEDWPENMPEDGTLELEVRQPAKERGLVVSAADAPPDALVRRPASDRFIDQLCFHLEEGPHNSSTTDSWRLELLGLLACTHVELSISQVAELLHAFPADLDAAPGVYERAHAAGKLCSNIPPELHPSLAATLADQQLLDDAELRAFHKLTGIPLPFRAVQRKCDADGARVGAGKRLPSASPMQPTSTGGTASTARNDGTSSSRTPTSPAGEAAQLPLELDSAGSESAHSPGSERAYLRQNSNGIWVPVG
ncbi:hypothetical protein WJX72_011614 [[Myrmecia] bisecta]|uniref:Uncharacterized protein n=1 Tax=[Myrmecia] bisecta TaxID=41462 RepID=A0AAW1QGH9_9CHLO